MQNTSRKDSSTGSSGYAAVCKYCEEKAVAMASPLRFRRLQAAWPQHWSPAQQPLAAQPPRTAVPLHRGADSPHICSPGPSPLPPRSCQLCLAVPNHVAEVLLLFMKQRDIQEGLGGLSRSLLFVTPARLETGPFKWQRVKSYVAARARLGLC